MYWATPFEIHTPSVEGISHKSSTGQIFKLINIMSNTV